MAKRQVTIDILDGSKKISKFDKGRNEQSAERTWISNDKISFLGPYVFCVQFKIHIDD